MHRVKVRATQRSQRARALEPRPPGGKDDKTFPSKYQAAAYQRYQHMVDGVLRDEPAADPSADPKPASAALAAASDKPGAEFAKPLPKRLEGRIVESLYQYKATATDELSFAVGDRIVVINEGGEEGWYYGICNQKTGLFPANYVTLAPEEEDAPGVSQAP